MAHLGKSLSKLLSPCRYTSVSVSPRKHHPGLKRGLKFSGVKDVPRKTETNLQESTRLSCEQRVISTPEINNNILQVPKHNAVLISSPVIRKLSEKGVHGVNCEHILGRGRFGTVIKGSYQGEPVAVKVIEKEKKKLKPNLKEENAVKLAHPNIIQFLKTVSGEGSYDIIMMEYCDGTNMLQKINNTKINFDKKKIMRYALELGYALQHCHKNRIIHLDIKPENIIIDEEDHCKLCDFGSSRILDSNNVVEAPWPGTPVYAAPEVLQGHCVTCSADIYSFGITLWHMLSREIPYFGEDTHSVIYKVVAQNHRPKCLKAKNEDDTDYIKLYEECWRQNSRERPTTDEAILFLLKMKKY